MKTLILYATRHGCAEKCATKLGGSIHAGKIQKGVKDFCAKNLEVLKGKRLGLYLCCMEEGPKAEAQFAAALNGSGG